LVDELLHLELREGRLGAERGQRGDVSRRSDGGRERERRGEHAEGEDCAHGEAALEVAGDAADEAGHKVSLWFHEETVGAAWRLSKNSAVASASFACAASRRRPARAQR